MESWYRHRRHKTEDNKKTKTKTTSLKQILPILGLLTIIKKKKQDAKQSTCSNSEDLRIMTWKEKKSITFIDSITWYDCHEKTAKYTKNSLNAIH